MWFLGTSSLVTNDLRGRGRPGTSSLLAGVMMVATIALDLVLIPPFGYVGAAVASLAVYVLFGVVSVIVLARLLGLPARTLVLPTRDDLAAYPAALRRVRSRLRPAPQT
jgi:Na+-driven multidrug efflux pump